MSLLRRLHIIVAVGFFVVTASGDKRNILFQVRTSPPGDPPEEQQTLITEIERTLRVLRHLFEGREEQFAVHFNDLLSLAQGGLVGDHAQPEIARRALVELKNEVLEREAGRVKNRHMTRLGESAAWLGIPGLVVAYVAETASTYPEMISPHGILSGHNVAAFGLLMAGCAAGVWVSFGARKAHLVFEDLSVPEQDQLNPATRLFFAALLTSALALLFHTGAAEVKVGSVSSARVFADPIAAMLIGFLAGFSEQVLSKTISDHATRFISPGRS